MNNFGKVSHIALTTGRRNQRTVIQEKSYTAPFKVAHPFYKKDGTAQVMLLSASAGIMAGDEQSFSFHVTEGTGLEITAQSYDKIFRMEEGSAFRKTDIQVDEHAYFFYDPLPTIPFADSCFESETNINLADDTSRFIMQEIISSGRKAMGEQFAYNRYDSLIEVRQAGKLIYRDNTKYRPAEWKMGEIGVFEGYSHLLNLLICNVDISDRQTKKIREWMEAQPEVTGGISRLPYGNGIIRVLGQNAQILQEVGDRIRCIVFEDTQRVTNVPFT